MKKKFSPQEKAAVALEAIRAELTIAQISSKYEVHPTQVGIWKSQVLKNMTDIFSNKRQKENRDNDQKIVDLYTIIGKRDTELEWLKKKLLPFGS